MIRTAVFAAVAALPTASALAWHDEGHIYAARAAVAALPDDVPAFLREGVDAVAHGALDPDVVRNRTLKQLAAADPPDHYIDWELLQGRELPPTREGYIALTHELGITPNKAGTLPYAIVERAQWLTVAFAEHRRWPENPHIQRKILVMAGALAHYTADLHMPLHTTVHYDGRVQATGGAKAPPKRIHARVDALPTKIPYAELYAEPIHAPEPREDLWAYTLDELARSHALVDRVYALEPRIPAMADLSLDDAEVRAFTTERMRAAAEFTAGMVLSAWRNSTDIELPAWLDREVFDSGFDPDHIPPQPAP